LGHNFCGKSCASQKTRKLNEPENPFVKLLPAYSVKLVFSYVVKGIKIKITAKFRDTEHLRFEDTKRIMSPEKFRGFRETGPRITVIRCTPNRNKQHRVSPHHAIAGGDARRGAQAPPQKFSDFN